MPPRDDYHLVRILFYTFGVLTQISDNFFVTANDYWMYKFRDPSVPYDSGDKTNRTTLQTNFTAQYNIVSQVTGVVMAITTVILARFVSVRLRIFATLTSMVSVFGVTLIFIAADTDSYQHTFYIITLITGSVLSGSCTMYVLTMFQLAAKFPPQYMNYLLSGQAICGIAAASAQIFSLGIGASTLGTAYIYFTIGGGCVLGSFIYFLLLYFRSEYFIYHMEQKLDFGEVKISGERIKSVAFTVRYFLITLVVVMGITIMINPGLTSLIVSVNPGHKWNDLFFVPVCTYLMFNVFDFIGRVASPIIQYPKNGLVIMMLAIIRIGLVPLILYCNLQPRQTPVLFHSDTDYILLIIAFALSNGYLMNLCVTRIPQITDNDLDQQIGTVLCLAAIILSLGICSLFSDVLVKSI